MRRVLSSHSRSRRSARLSSRTDWAHVNEGSAALCGSVSIRRSSTDHCTVRSTSSCAIAASACFTTREGDCLQRVEAADAPVQAVLGLRVASQLVEAAIHQAHWASHDAAGLPVFELVRLDLVDELLQNGHRHCLEPCLYHDSGSLRPAQEARALALLLLRLAHQHLDAFLRPPRADFVARAVERAPENGSGL